MPRRRWLRRACCSRSRASRSSAAAAFASEPLEDGLRRKASGQVFSTLARCVTDVDRRRLRRRSAACAIRRRSTRRVYPVRARRARQRHRRGRRRRRPAADVARISRNRRQAETPGRRKPGRRARRARELPGRRRRAGRRRRSRSRRCSTASRSEGVVGAARLLAQRLHHAVALPSVHRQPRRPSRGRHAGRRLQGATVRGRLLLRPGRVVRRAGVSASASIAPTSPTTRGRIATKRYSTFTTAGSLAVPAATVVQERDRSSSSGARPIGRCSCT